MRPADNRAVAYLKAIHENPENLASTINAAAAALRHITGEEAKNLLPAADYFLRDANRYYFGGAEIDRELTDAKHTFWVWVPTADNNRGALQDVTVPQFTLSDLYAERAAYRGMAIAKDKSPFQVLLASIFIQEKNRVDTLNKLLAVADLSHPETQQQKSDAGKWLKRLDTYTRISYIFNANYLLGVIEKGLRDGKSEVVIDALETLAEVVDETDTAAPSGWSKIADYQAVSGAAAATGETARQHPVLAALASRNSRLAIAAANTLVKIGLPTSHAAYHQLLPILLDGARENRATVVEVISGDAQLRSQISADLEQGQMLPLAARDGYVGYNLAVQYPPKDVILLDNRTDQFNTIRLQMELRDIAQNRILPMTIITTNEHVANIANQFARDDIQKKAAARHTDSERHLTQGSDNSFESDDWRVEIRRNAGVEQVEGGRRSLFADLQATMRRDRKQVVVIITNPSREERYKIKENLLLQAERSMRPEQQSAYATLRNKEKVLGDVFGVQVTYAPVFVDEEISGYDTMKTVQALQIDPRTRFVPIAILADGAEEKNVRDDFERFLTDGVVEVLARDMDAKVLIAKVGELLKKNKLSEKNYTRALSNKIALQSNLSLTKLNVAAGKALTVPEQQDLFAVVSDTTRPVNLRIAAAKAIGHFAAANVLTSLMDLFTQTAAQEVALRAEIMRAVGKIDTANAELKFKLDAAHNETAAPVQAAAMFALGAAAQNQSELETYLDTLTVNAPLTLATEITAPDAAPTGAADADDDGDETAPEEDTATDTEAEPAAGGGFDW
jgi:hypothetical protein